MEDQVRQWKNQSTDDNTSRNPTTKSDMTRSIRFDNRTTIASRHTYLLSEARSLAFDFQDGGQNRQSNNRQIKLPTPKSKTAYYE